MNDGRKPEECHYAIGFDGIYVCRACCLPCARVGLCPRSEKAEENLRAAVKAVLAKEVIGQ